MLSGLHPHPLAPEHSLSPTHEPLHVAASEEG